MFNHLKIIMAVFSLKCSNNQCYWTLKNIWMINMYPKFQGSKVTWIFMSNYLISHLMKTEGVCMQGWMWWLNESAINLQLFKCHSCSTVSTAERRWYYPLPMGHLQEWDLHEKWDLVALLSLIPLLLLSLHPLACLYNQDEPLTFGPRMT